MPTNIVLLFTAFRKSMLRVCVNGDFPIKLSCVYFMCMPCCKDALLLTGERTEITRVLCKKPKFPFILVKCCGLYLWRDFGVRTEATGFFFFFF